ncbi:ATPase [Spirochaetia bacterium]|nr:ATPase [Spirochaetia bacterium]
MERRLFSALGAWKTKQGRQPLIVEGARQVGKTWLINEFGRREFQNVIYIDFEKNRRIGSFFEEDIAPEKIVRYLEGEFGEAIIPGKTLLFFDEIQACERALTSLKYFCDEAPDIPVIAAGSLLGVALNREQYSFPVGKVETLRLLPLDFEEFLWALGKQWLCAEIRLSCEQDKKMPLALHGELLELYKLFLITGGMPKVVSVYAEEQSLVNVAVIQNEIMNNYIADMAKYASPQESVKIRACYNSIPNQLAKDNKKFQYKVVKSGGSAAIFGASIEWLNFAGVALKCDKVTNPRLPLAVYTEPGSFKLYMADVGMLTMKAALPQGMILSNLEVDNTFLGALAENYAAVSLSALGYPLYYWQSDNTAEVDFTIQKDEQVIPVEVKAGTHVKSRSLSVFGAQYGYDYAIRISTKNFGFENRIKSVPLYAVFCM